MAKRGRPRAFDRDDALQVAMTIFWEKGYEGASLDDLQSGIGDISPPSFYAAFHSKERLFLDAVDLYLKTFGDRPARALEAQPTAREGVEAMLREGVGLFCGPDTPHGCLVALGAVNCTPASKPIQDRMASYRTQLPLLIRKRLKRGVTEGDVPKGVDQDPLVSLYATFFHGLPLRARDGTSRKALLAGVVGAMAAWDVLIAGGTTRDH